MGASCEIVGRSRTVSTLLLSCTRMRWFEHVPPGLAEPTRLQIDRLGDVSPQRFPSLPGRTRTMSVRHSVPDLYLRDRYQKPICKSSICDALLFQFDKFLTGSCNHATGDHAAINCSYLYENTLICLLPDGSSGQRRTPVNIAPRPEIGCANKVFERSIPTILREALRQLVT